VIIKYVGAKKRALHYIIILLVIIHLSHASHVLESRDGQLRRANVQLIHLGCQSGTHEVTRHFIGNIYLMAAILHYHLLAKWSPIISIDLDLIWLTVSLNRVFSFRLQINTGDT
jgi:hypothetical protein